MSNQSKRQESVRGITSTTSTYEGDWHALFDLYGISEGAFNSRLLAFLNFALSASYIELNGAMNEFAVLNGASTWNEMGTITDFGALQPELQSVLDRATALSYTLPSDAQITKQNNLILHFKYSGIWDLFDVLYIMNAGSQEYSTLNFKNPNTNQITSLNSPAWANNGGSTGNGINSYLDTNFNPVTQGVNYTLDNASRIIWVKTDGGSLIDGITTTGNNRATTTSSTQQRINQGTTNLNASANLAGTGLKAINRTSNNNVEIFVNTTQFSRTAASSSLVSENQFIHRSGTVYGTNEISIYGMGADLSALNTPLYNALNTYMS